jgi:hypothetical protein
MRPMKRPGWDVRRWILSMEGMRKTTKPVGIPISRFLSTKIDAAGRIAEKALSIIDSVHGSQRLPRIPVDSEGTLYRPAGYTRTQSGKAVSINISPKSQFPLVDFTQEVGHFLDHQAIGEKGTFASAHDPALGRWREMVQDTEPVKRLIQLAGQERAKVVFPDGSAGFLKVDRVYVRYLLEPHEIFSRCYGQFIAEKSRNAAMLKEIATLRSVRKGTVHYPVNWSEGEFSAILDEIERIIMKLGWII